jgi:hypothetical protein
MLIVVRTILLQVLLVLTLYGSLMTQVNKRRVLNIVLNRASLIVRHGCFLLDAAHLTDGRQVLLQFIQNSHELLQLLGLLLLRLCLRWKVTLPMLRKMCLLVQLTLLDVS